MFIFVALIGISYGAAPSCFEREECATVSSSGQYGWSCLSYDSCYQTIMTDTVIVNCYGYEGCEEAQITTKYNDDAYTNCDGIKACQNAIISSAIVYVRGYLGAFGAQIQAINLYGTGHEALKNADIEARATILNVTLDGYFSGRDASIICRSGDECNVYCIGYGCSGANFYCYSGATCFYDCEETPDHCPTLIGGVDSSLSDTEIHQIYLDNKQSHAVKSNQYPRDGFFADVNPKNVGLNTLFTAQTLGLMAGCLFVGLSLGLCAFNCRNLMKGEKNFDFKNNKLEFN